MDTWKNLISIFDKGDTSVLCNFSQGSAQARLCHNLDLGPKSCKSEPNSFKLANVLSNQGSRDAKFPAYTCNGPLKAARCHRNKTDYKELHMNMINTLLKPQKCREGFC
ncbi:hypothetical protein Zmor_003009 [Zophobas morio]|uniref:Uncharacterized protein n=1 Tax=Zophobas morio TaxID=2755281 RepID=A0AA38M0T4_9CUCU|nr:hypothetical protein Zmor_003009 [Zophobas morio]